MATTERRTEGAAAATTRSTTVPALQGAWWKWGTGLVMCFVIYGAFFIAGGAVGFGKTGDIARIVFFHVPGAILSSVCYFVGACFAGVYLFKQFAPEKAAEIDAKSAIAMELGFLFCILATITGSIFAGMQWNSYWNWDPREISIVIMLLLYASYLVLRAALAGRPTQRAKLAAVYALVALVPAQYLIWAVPRLVAFTNHPINVLFEQERLSATYKIVLYSSFLAFTMLYIWMSQLRFRVYKLRTRVEGKRG
jgi:heme exporter protein C